jgi:hypothetical protein
MKKALDSTQEIAAIVAGLLASGHYTELDHDDDPSVRQYDTGSDWLEQGEKSRYRMHVMDDAFAIWRRIQTDAIEHDEA